MEKIYHIYAKEKCILPNVSENEFETAWTTLNNMVGLMRTEYSQEDLSYEELTYVRDHLKDSSY
jgi:hypothetical protein